MKPTKIIIIGAGPAGVTATILAQLKSDYGSDITVLEKEAKDQGVLPGTIPEVRPFTLKSLPIIEMPKMMDIKEQHKHDCKKGWRNHR